MQVPMINSEQPEVGAMVEFVRLGTVYTGTVVDIIGGNPEVCVIELDSPAEYVGRKVERDRTFQFRNVCNP